jgi:biofilm protein TabA
MPVYEFRNDINSIIGSFKYPEHIKDYLDSFHRRFSTEAACKKLEIGFNRVDIVEGIFAIEQVYMSRDFNLCKYESHKKYTDLHYIAQGEEVHYVSNINKLKLKDKYNKKGDFFLYESEVKHNIKIFTQEEVAIYLPSDAHMTGVQVDRSTLIVKTVIKIPNIGG